MPLSFSQLLTLALEIEEEEAPGANSAERVGSFLAFLTKASSMAYDAGTTYDAGQYTFFGDGVFRAMVNIDVGESPSAAPEKWRSVVGNLQTILQNGEETTIQPNFKAGIKGIFGKTTENYNPAVFGPGGVLLEKVAVITEPNPVIIIDGFFEEVTPKVGVGIFRLADASHNDPLQVNEGSTLPIRLEEQQSDDSWEISDAERTWSLESATPGATIPDGVLTIPADSISTNSVLTVKATLADSSVVQAPVNIININPADSVDIDAPNADWKGLHAIKRQILVDPQNPALYWLRYLIKAGSNIDNEVTYGTNAPYRATLIPTLALPDGYSREGGSTLVQPGKVVKNRFFYEGSNAVLFEETLTVSATSALTTVYSASPLP